MIDFFKRKKNSFSSNSTPVSMKGGENDIERKDEDGTHNKTDSKNGKGEKTLEGENNLFKRLKAGLTRTRHTFTEGLSTLFLGKKEIDPTLLEELEEILLSNDVGVLATQEIIDCLTEQLKRNELKDREALELALKKHLIEMLLPCEQALEIPKSDKPFVMLMVGINGSGKTTTIGKIAHRLQKENKSIILAAGDTFRAAAIDQLKIWGERNQVQVIAQNPGSDSASVVFDAFQSAISRKIDVLLADTAGRLHTQSHLMDELKKVSRVLKKLDPEAPQEVMLVLDASIGQNALNQATKFHEAIKVTGITITKLDGTARGGILFNIAKTLKLPIRYIGVGEKLEDLRPFHAEEFVHALFDDFNDQ